MELNYRFERNSLKELEKLNDTITESLQVYVSERPNSSIDIDFDAENLVINLRIVIDDGTGEDIEGRIFANRHSV
jgi:outer membrane protein assembly factor BamA